MGNSRMKEKRRLSIEKIWEMHKDILLSRERARAKSILFYTLYSNLTSSYKLGRICTFEFFNGIQNKKSQEQRSDLEHKEKEENIFFTWDNLLLLFSLMIITKRFSFSTESFPSGRKLELRFKLMENKKYNNIHLRIYLTYSRHSSLSLFQEWGRDFWLSWVLSL